ncbi:hypothetical protein B0F90DRAFT_1928281 [Multifurca ochricompacta]|uniref:F-box domain-containing protein n=1 Tax=Multifurca ochricompacta TaxID=376703 RepID=A0AAD4LXC6_9AGAM|nr:hypothetical protein B0F90DRAFT_1928281 [Multifurca ochricompacta]
MSSYAPSMSSQQSPNPNRATSRVLKPSPTGAISRVNGTIPRLFSKVKKKQTDGCGSSLHDNSTGEDHECVAINSLPDDVLLEIFNRHRLSTFPNDPTDDMWEWHRLTHVCRKWRYVIFASPHRLDLRLLCKQGTPVRRTLDCWPALPISIQYSGFTGRPPPALRDEDNIIAALEHPARIYEIQLSLTKSLFNKLAALKQQPFPVLEHFRLTSFDRAKLSTLPSTFFCESASRLRVLFFYGIPFSMLPKFLLSTKDLVDLTLRDIPSAGYFSPESLVTSLSGMTQLKTLYIGFASPSSRPNRRSVPPLRRAVLSTLTSFTFCGISEYLEDVVAGIDAPALGHFYVKLFNQLMFDVPQLHQFISRAERLRVPSEARLESFKNGVSITLFQPPRTYTSGYLSLWIACNPFDWQVSSIAEICNQSSTLFSRVEQLYILGHVSQPGREDEIGATEWFELFRPFTAVRSLYVSKFLGPLVVDALEDTADGPVMEVLPALRLLQFEGSQNQHLLRSSSPHASSPISLP